VPFDAEKFLAKVQAVVTREGYCVIVTAEGLAMHNPGLHQEAGPDQGEHGKDRLNVHTGKAAPFIAALVHEKLGLRCHFSVSDYLQRSARHIASSVDVDAAFRVGEAAVELALQGRHLVMPGLVRKEGARGTRWAIAPQPLKPVAQRECGLPRRFIARDGFGITPRCRAYLLPLIQGEDYPPYAGGLPRYGRLRREKVAKRLPPFAETPAA
jgi:6-phosphofructokinase 1